MPEKNVEDRIRDLLINGTKGQRWELCRREPAYFMAYYFSNYVTHDVPDFHWQFYDDCKDLLSGKASEIAWIAFRDSAKTSIAKIALITHAICYEEKKYINVDSYDKGNAESILFDVTLALQTNRLLIGDFGQLYHKKPQKEALSEATMKRISNFITENGIKVEAFSTQESTRGRLYQNNRPDLILFDDFENSKTKDSYPIILKIIDHINEWRAGRPAHACALYLGNYITESGAVEHVMDAIKRSGPDHGRIRLINAEDRDGNPLWPAKHTKTRQEALEFNKTVTDPRARKISLEEKRQELGEAVYQMEMMNNPALAGDKLFDRPRIEELLRNAREPRRIVAGLKIWFEYDPSHRYAIAADTAKGIGKDANASVIIDFSTIPNRIVATYKNNRMPPDVFAFELKRQAEMYGLPLVAPENNNTGQATITQLKRIYKNIFVAVKDQKVKEVIADEYGWNTNGATKPEMMYQIKRAIEDGLLVTWDEDVLNEMKFYSQKDLATMKLVEGMTKHFDLLTAAAICWMMRSHAKLSSVHKRPLNQAPHVPTLGEYGG